MELLFITVGFLLASYSIIANDAIQTLGTFLSSNGKRPWWFLWAFAGSILSVVLVYGWWANGGDVSYGRLSRIPVAETIQWWHVLPPLVLLFLTRMGIPISTTFLVLSVFTPSFLLGKIIIKSLIGYGIAFIAAIVLWAVISKKVEKKFINSENNKKRWILAQWVATGFLWSQWLIQDLANIYVFLPRQLQLFELLGTLVVMLILLAIIFRGKGGKIQKIVESKTNTNDIRSATFIDGLFAMVLFFFKEINKPSHVNHLGLSPGVLAGREYAMTHSLKLFQLKRPSEPPPWIYPKLPQDSLFSVS